MSLTGNMDSTKLNGSLSDGNNIGGKISSPNQELNGDLSAGNKAGGKIAGLKVYHTDAYAIAVKRGFNGTIDEWLESLKGKKPVKGIDYYTEEEVQEIIDAVLGNIEVETIAVDSAFSTTSANPVQNKVITKVIHDLELMIGEEIWPHLAPKVNSNNNGQIMQVVGGKWVPVTIDLEDGEDGFSPKVVVSEIQGGHRIAITSVDGTEYVDVMNGKDGEDGYTPVKGKDYFTAADKAEMVSSVIAALPVYDGSVTSV